LARLRSTALPILRLAVKPTRARPPFRSGIGDVSRVSPGVTRRNPFATRTKSARLFRRSSLGFRSGCGGSAVVSVRPTVSCGRARAGGPAPCGRRRLPCAPENRVGASERSCSADRCASWLWLRIRSRSGSRASRHHGKTCQPSTPGPLAAGPHRRQPKKRRRDARGSRNENPSEWKGEICMPATSE
jgi:hypothetical protein